MNTARWHRLLFTLVLCLGACLPIATHAGRNCEDKPADAAKTQKALRFGQQVRESLELSGANVALIGRVGTDQSKRGVLITHMGFVMREHPAGAWTVVHELNACGTGSSDLFDEGLANFFMDDPFDYQTKIVIPAPELQGRIAKVLLGPLKRSLHEPVYSSIAYPWATKHQNSNGWVLEVIAAAASPDVHNREHAQSWLKENNYQPTRIHISAGERAGARLFTPHVRFGDHPDVAWQTQTYEVNTGDSVVEFVRKFDPQARTFSQRVDSRAVNIVRPDSPPSAAAPISAEPAVSARPPVTVAAVVTPVAAPVASPTLTTPSAQGRAQLLQSMQGLIMAYACRPQGYLALCRQLERSSCERQVSDAVLRCFATVSDQQLMSGTEQDAMRQMQEIGYCAVEGVDASLSTTAKRPQTPLGQSCVSVRNFK